MTDEPTPDQQQPAPEPDVADQAVYRDINTLLATVDQHSAEIDALNIQVLVQAFALGAIAALLLMLYRNQNGLADALAG